MSKPYGIESGTRLDRYTILEEIGSGGFGKVFKARDQDTGAVVAIKVAASGSGQSTATRRFRRFTDQQNEVEALLRLSHPSIVKIHECGQLPDDRLYIVMEFVEGVPLSERIRQRQFEPFEAIRITQKIAEAVAYSHECGILHLDLKPQNIILVDFIDPLDPKIKVLDFGLARLTQMLNIGTGSAAGTISYMPPEAFSAQRPVPDTRFDTHAIGTILYEMITGRLPFRGQRPEEIILNKVTGVSVPFAQLCPNAPTDLVRLIDSLLARDPAQRLGDARALAERLRATYFGAFANTDQKHAEAPEPRSSQTHSSQVPEDTLFIGRGREFDLLSQRYANVQEGRGHFVILEGDAGIGKSRLVSELLVSPAVRSRALIGYGRCRQIGFDVPFSALREALGQLGEVIRRSGDGVGEQLRASARRALDGEGRLLLKIVPELGALISDTQLAPELATRMMGPRHIALAMNTFLSSLATIKPVILVLEDLHWADEGTRSMQAELSGQPVPVGVLILGTQRPHGRPELDIQAEILPLDPLDATASDAQLQCLLRGCSTETLERLKTAVPLLRVGNPLYNIHVVRNLISRHYIKVAQDGSFSIADEFDYQFEVPATVAAALELTVNTLSPIVRRVLAVAALFGRSFRVSDLAALELHARDQIEEALAVAEENVLCTREGDACLFVHDVIREQLERMSPAELLPDLHRRVALHLKENPKTESSILAHHFERAGMPMAAGRCSLMASKEAEDMIDPVGARAHLFSAARLLRQVSPAADAARDELLVRTAHELSRVGSMMSVTDEVLRELQLCAAEIREPTIPERVTLDCAFARHHYTRGEFVEALELSQKCLAIISTRPELASLSCVPLNILGRALAASGQFGQAVQTLTRGCEVAERLGEYLELSHSQGLLGVSLAFTGDFERARAMADLCYETAAHLRDPVRTAGALFYRSVVADAEFDWKNGVDYSVRILRFCEEFSISGIYLQLGALMGGRHQFHVGQLRRAEVLLGNSLNLASVMGVKTSIGWAWAYLGDTLFAAGNFDEARRCYTKGLDPEKKRAREDLAAGIGLCGLAHIEAMTGGSFDECVRLAEEAVARFGAVSNRSMMVNTLQRYAESMDLFGRRDLAEQLWRRMEDLVRQIGCRDVDWWPEIPGRTTAAGVLGWEALRARSAAHRRYWCQFMDQPSEGALEEGFGTTELVNPAMEADPPGLFLSLASVESFIPEYLSKTYDRMEPT